MSFSSILNSWCAGVMHTYCNDDVVATKVAGVDVSLGMDVTAPLVFTVGLGDWPLS